MYVGDDPKEKTSSGESYTTVAARNSAIEEKIGLSLAMNGEIPKLAEKIKNECLLPSASSSTASSSGGLSKKDQWKIGEFGGAQSVNDGWDTLGGSVFEVMEEIEKTNDLKTEYSISNTANHPYFGQGVKKKEFDKALKDVEIDELPKTAKSFLESNSLGRDTQIYVNYNKLSSNARFEILHDYRHLNPDAETTATSLVDKLKDDKEMKDINDGLNNLNSAEGRMKLITSINAIRKGDGATDEMKAKLGALLDIVVDKHTSGGYTNMVKRGQNAEMNPQENQWIEDTAKAGKPIISGPSGHTLRYLNFWAEKRDVKKKKSEDVGSLPSLQAARLIMMADLMPPKHHSYDEIMTSSIGITDGMSAPLKYESKSSYMDLAMQGEPDAQDIALQAYKDSKAYEIIPNNNLDNALARKEAIISNSIVANSEGTETDENDSLMSERALRAKAVNERNQTGRDFEFNNHSDLITKHNETIDQAIKELKKMSGVDINAAVISLHNQKRSLSNCFS